MTDPRLTRAQTAVDALSSAYEAAVEALDAVPDRQQAFNEATRMGKVIDNLRTRNGQLRADIAAEIYRAESLSLAGLAERIGISRGRAQDLVEQARTPEEDTPDE